MTVTKNEELVKRIARLARQNQELEQQIKKLEKINEKLAGENEKIKALVKDFPSTDEEKARGKRDNSLKFNMTTVLFAEIHPISKAIGEMDSVPVMDELDEIFYKLDSVATKYKIEKIKTIGDTFMCAGGIPVKNITNPVDVVMAALRCRTIEEFKSRNRNGNRNIWLKIGIHTDPDGCSFRKEEDQLWI
jgi:class 3 adenylate cyclase